MPVTAGDTSGALATFGLNPAGARTRLLLLCGLVVSVGFSPRLRLLNVSGKAVDLRVQDLLVLLAVAVLLLGTRDRNPHVMRIVWGRWVGLFALAVTASTAVHLLAIDTIASRTVSFYLRGLEPFVLAMVIARLYIDSLPWSRRWALNSLHALVAGNGMWVAYQVLSGTERTLFPSPPGIASYGVQMVGEASAFGAGMMGAFITVLGVAEYRARAVPRTAALSAIAVGLGSSYLTGSRVSLGISVAAACFLFLRTDRLRRFHAVRALVLLLLGLYLGQQIVGELGARLQPERVMYSLAETRASSIWPPLFDAALANPVVGIGPGELGTDAYRATEAHNIILRLALDYGMAAVVLGVGLLLRVAATAWRIARIASIGPHLASYAVCCYAWVGSVAFAGIVQDSLTAVTTSHLLMVVVGLFAAELHVYTQGGAGGGGGSGGWGHKIRSGRGGNVAAVGGWG